MQQVNPLLQQRLLGIVAFVVATIIALVAGFLYISPPNQQVVYFYTNDAASLRPGDTVRVAGIVVGTVKGLTLEAHQVRVRVSVDGKAKVGDQSQIQVRMLTIVGGYYVNLITLGAKPLGNQTIPQERVTMPYSLMRALSDATKITENVAPRPIKDSLDQLQQGLRGSNIESITAVLNAGNSIADTLDSQRGALTQILNLSDEYIDKLANYRDTLQRYIRKVAILEQTLVMYGKAFGEAISGLGAIVRAIRPADDMYFMHRQDFYDRIEGILGDLRTIASRNGALVRFLGRVHDRMERQLDRQNNFIRPELLATDICVPVHGSPC